MGRQGVLLTAVTAQPLSLSLCMAFLLIKPALSHTTIAASLPRLRDIVTIQAESLCAMLSLEFLLSSNKFGLSLCFIYFHIPLIIT